MNLNRGLQHKICRVDVIALIIFMWWQ